MVSAYERPILSPEDIAVRAGEQVPFLRLPEPTIFAEREMRLRQRAADLPAMRDFLLFTAELAGCQQRALERHPEVPLPDAPSLDHAARAGMPPLPSGLWPRDKAWQAVLSGLLGDLATRLAASAAADAVARLRAAEFDWIEQQADRLLAGVMLGLDLATAPLLAAALQVHFTHLVRATSAAHPTAFGRVDEVTRCPCCASLPTASVSRIGGDASGFRYLHCALCSTEWHQVRIKCTHCQTTRGIHYESLQAVGESREGGLSAQAAIEAETCDECGHYLKIVHMERDPHVEPVADDLATLTLDLLVADSGFRRHGINMMLLFGDSGDEAEP